ncbi:MAG: hypothetical protein HFH74_11025 [Lachnospiraceae bacterium]|jgi:alpha-N-arabinofuranosidase|nr:hypothetical protein [Lachnospiraceae bacterium]
MDNIPEGGEAGISIYLNYQHHYEIAITMLSQKHCLILRRQVGKLKAIENIVSHNSNAVILQLTGSRAEYAFAYCSSEQDTPVPIGAGETQYLTTEVGGCFTGNFIAIYAVNTDVICKKFTYTVK